MHWNFDRIKGFFNSRFPKLQSVIAGTKESIAEENGFSREEMKRSDFPEMLAKRTSLTNAELKSVVAYYTEHIKMKLDLSGLPSISDEQFDILDDYEGSIDFSGLKKITDNQAEKLANRRQVLLNLSGLKEITDKQAEYISKAKCSVLKLGISTITDEQARFLSLGEYRHLRLINITELNDKQSEYIGNFEGFIYLPKLEKISDTQMELICKNEGKYIDFSGVKEISENQSILIGNKCSEVKLGITKSSKTQLENLSNVKKLSLKDLNLNDEDLKTLINNYKGYPKDRRKNIPEFSATICLGLNSLTQSNAKILSILKSKCQRLELPKIKTMKNEDIKPLLDMEVDRGYGIKLNFSGLTKITQSQKKEFENRGWSFPENCPIEG